VCISVRTVFGLRNAAKESIFNTEKPGKGTDFTERKSLALRALFARTPRAKRLNPYYSVKSVPFPCFSVLSPFLRPTFRTHQRDTPTRATPPSVRWGLTRDPIAAPYRPGTRSGIGEGTRHGEGTEGRGSDGPMETVNIDGDSTFALMLEAQARGHTMWHYEVRHLALREASRNRMAASGRNGCSPARGP